MKSTIRIIMIFGSVNLAFSLCPEPPDTVKEIAEKYFESSFRGENAVSFWMAVTELPAEKLKGAKIGDAKIRYNINDTIIDNLENNNDLNKILSNNMKTDWLLPVMTGDGLFAYNMQITRNKKTGKWQLESGELCGQYNILKAKGYLRKNSCYKEILYRTKGYQRLYVIEENIDGYKIVKIRSKDNKIITNILSDKDVIKSLKEDRKDDKN